MRSDNEMLENILRKAHEKEKRMKKIKKTVSGTLAVIVAAAAISGAGYLMKKAPALPDESALKTEANATDLETQPKEKGFSLMIASAAETDETEEITVVEHNAKVKLPIYGKLVIENAAGMTDEEKNRRHNDLNNELTADWQASKDATHVGGAESENYIGSLALRGRFILFADDADELSEIKLTCGKFGNLLLLPATQYGKAPVLGATWYTAIRAGNEITISAEEYSNIYTNRTSEDGEQIGMFLSFDISEELLNEKELNPDMGYEDISYEIEFCAVYKDGASKSYTITVSFDKNGEMTATAQG
ncbi:MAG: hypothetical protein IJS90_10525 [Clostridia bacterium]|nr:hypothetical protein [Clostridia bacterium]